MLRAFPGRHLEDSSALARSDDDSHLRKTLTRLSSPRFDDPSIYFLLEVIGYVIVVTTGSCQQAVQIKDT